MTNQNPPEFDLIKRLTLALGFDGKKIPEISVHGREIIDESAFYYRAPVWSRRFMTEPAPTGMNFTFSFERSRDAKSGAENQRIMKEDVVLGNVISGVIRACDPRAVEQQFNLGMEHLGHNSRGKSCGTLNFSMVQSAREDFNFTLRAVTEAIGKDPTIAQKIMQAVAIEQTMYDSVKKIEVTLNQMSNKLSSEILVEPKTEQLKNAMTEIFGVPPKDGVYRVSDKEYGKLEQAVTLSDRILEQGENVAEAVFKLVKVLNPKVQVNPKGQFDRDDGLYAQFTEATKMGGKFELSFGGQGNPQFARLINNMILANGIDVEKIVYTGGVGYGLKMDCRQNLNPLVDGLAKLNGVLSAEMSMEKTALSAILENGANIENRLKDSLTKLHPNFDSDKGTLVLYIDTKSEELKGLFKDGQKPNITMIGENRIKAEGAAAITELMGATADLIRSMPAARNKSS
jgi:hypothetical protein